MRSFIKIFLLLACVAAGAIFLLPKTFMKDDRPKPSVAKMLFVGDMMFDRTIRAIAEKNGYSYLFSCLAPYLKSFDAVIGNLEGPITFADSWSVGTKPGIQGNTSFTFSPLSAYALASHNVRVLNLGNNHILDRGWEGIEATTRVLEDNGLSYFGVPGGDIATTTEVGGVDIGSVNFNQFLGQNDPEKAILAIRSMKKEGIFTVVYAHWGDEYLSETDKEISWARSFVDAGADLVIGSHPHVIQGIETYKGKRIYYSLGNFIFDQYFSDGVRRGLGVEVSIVGNDVTYKEVFFDIARDGTTCLSTTR